MAELKVVRKLEATHGVKPHVHKVYEDINTVLEEMDKRNLDDIPELRNATAETVAIFVIKHLKNYDSLNYVTVWDTHEDYMKIFASEICD